MYKFFAVTLLVAMLIPVDSSADPIIIEEETPHQIQTTVADPVCQDCDCCKCDEAVARKRPVAKAIRSLRVRKFVGKLIGVKR